MTRLARGWFGLLAMVLPVVCGGQSADLPSFRYDEASSHEMKPHRRAIPVDGVESGFNQLHLTLTVSPVGFVTHAEAKGDDNVMRHWPELQGEIYQWKFKPFEKNGSAVTARVEEYVNLVPPERLPKVHVAAPVLRKDSKVSIELRRTGCFGTCPSYTVTIATDGIVFDGERFVVAMGRHVAPIDPDDVRALVKKFVDADFYSMEEVYRAGVTDNPSYVLRLSIDGHEKHVLDYVGQWVGMPAAIRDLEDEVDTVANTERWIRGSDGLVSALRNERYDFQSYGAQEMLKGATRNGEADTVRGLLDSGVPLEPLPAPKNEAGTVHLDIGWLLSAANHPEVLQLLIAAKASKSDQMDKDLALNEAARFGKADGARALIAYGANPKVDLSKLTVTENAGGMTMQGPGAGSILISAAESGNPEMVREILRYRPKLEARGGHRITALFAAGEYRDGDEDGARAVCVRLLVKAGANVNARDEDGNTPLHETFLTEVEEELLKLGADVNAQNKDGETPIFTTVDDEALALYIAHGADLSIRNKKGETVVEAANGKGPLRVEALRKAIAEAKRD